MECGDIKQKIIHKLEQLESFTEIVSVSATLMEEDFICNPLIYGGAERYIILGVHYVHDICIDLCDELGLKPFVSVEQLLQGMTKNKVFPGWLAENLLTDISDFSERDNDESKVSDKSELYGKLDQIVSDFRHFKKYVLEYLI